MKKLLIILIILTITSCKKEEFNLVANRTADHLAVEPPTKKEYQLFLDFDSLKQKTGIEVMSGPIVVDYDNNGKYDIIVNRHNKNRTANSYTYELLNPVVILDSKKIIEITNLWKGGTTSVVEDFNGDGYKDIAIMDNGPEFWDLNSNPTKTPLTVYWNNKGNFDGSNTFVKEMTNGCFNINTGDVDKDGKFEIIPMGNQFEDFSYEFNDNRFIKTEIPNLKNISHAGAIYGDFNKDGLEDIFSYGFHISGNLSLFKPTIIHGVYGINQLSTLDLPNNIYINIMLSGDFDKNGLTDFILIARKQGDGGIPLDNNHYLYYVNNLGNNQYKIESGKLPEYLNQNNNSGYPMLYVVKDIDSDGDLDFYNLNSKMSIFFINKNGTFNYGLQ
jgi:hypothetical protein